MKRAAATALPVRAAKHPMRARLAQKAAELPLPKGARQELPAVVPRLQAAP